ncbi:MAG: phosphopantothenate/pantothenate synthetase [Candidatus Micrarchaeia archaeon]
MEKIPKSHPRYRSLVERHKIEKGVRAGITSLQGLIAQGRGEMFDYLIGERTIPPARNAIKAAARMLVSSSKPVISVNGNVAALCAEDIVKLSHVLHAPIEVNLFYRKRKRELAIRRHFMKFGVSILGAGKKVRMKAPASARALVDRRGIYLADTVLVAVEDGDRTEALRKAGKNVIAIDLNPLSRTSQKASITIVDNVTRAIPLLTAEIAKLKASGAAAGAVRFDNKKNLRRAIAYMLKRLERISGRFMRQC